MGREETIKAMGAGKPSKTPHKLAVFLVILITNIITYFFASSGGWATVHERQQELKHYELEQHNSVASNLPSMSTPVMELLDQLNQTQLDLLITQKTLINFQTGLSESEEHSEKLHKDMSQAMELIRAATQSMAEKSTLVSSQKENNEGNDVWSEWARLAKEDDYLIRELQEFIEARKLPLGWSTGLASDSMISPIGHACVLNKKDLQQFMDYDVGGECPDDQTIGQTLVLHGCEPLPRRRCFARIPSNFSGPYPFPTSLWTIPPNNNIHWTGYTCKSFECLNDRKNHHVFQDCLDCFELHGREKSRWVGRGRSVDFTIKEVLAMKNGTIRIGLDIGGGTGSFAVRMKEEDVTIVTTTMNFDGPFNNMIALRGVVPLYMTISQRLPFFDNTLDIVHSMHVLSNWIPTETLEFILFDIDRILRPGGLFWLDHFFCTRPGLIQVYVPLIEKLGYKVLKWAVADKLDKGAARQEVYLSALLEKPYSRGGSALEA